MPEHENPTPGKLPQKMPTYIGCKLVNAIPMNERTFFTTIKGETWSDHLRVNRTGYLVVYPDGYKSWSPQETFERAYRVVTAEEMDLLPRG